MKDLFSTLALFALLSIAFSGLTSCSGTETNVATGNSGKTPGVNNSPGGNKSAAYPPLPAALADTQFEQADGTKTKISDLKGKVVLFNLWGTWCGPCREEMPHLEAMHQKYRDQGFELVGLNIGDQSGGDESFDLIKKFAGEMKLSYTLARMDDQGTRQFYLLSKKEVVPQTFLVDREGHLRGVFIGGGAKIISSMKETVDRTMRE